MAKAAIGFKAHTGWAAAVAVAGTRDAIEVVLKAKVEMASGFDEAGVYHAGQELSLKKAEAMIRAAEEKFERRAKAGIGALAGEVEARGIRVVAGAIAGGGGKALPPLEAILKSHALVHTAEGELFREVIARACASLKMPAKRVPQKVLPELARSVLGLSEAKMAEVLSAIGKASGRPWASDQKEAAMAAIAVLFG